MNGLTLRLSEDGIKLQAHCDPNAGTRPIDETPIRKALEDGGFSEFYLFNNACGELVNRFNSGSAPFVFDIGERRDGTFSLTISPDLMTVSLTLTPPYGGKAVTSQQILDALSAQGITHGIQPDAISKAATACRALNKPIAVGHPAVPGANGELLSLIPEMKERCPHQEDEKSIVDYRDLGGIISVKPGDPLMRRVPPTEGTPGENVKGEPVPAIVGTEAVFAPSLSGTAFADDDNDLLVAAIAGQPILVANGVIVEPTINVKTVDLSTGNITIEGSLVVAGDIASGMVVKASGDIIVGGTVEAAMLEAGGNVEVKGGIIFAHIHAKGSVSALYAEKAHLHAGGNIALRELSMQSEIKAGGPVFVGERGMKKGHIIGGLCRSATMVHAVVIGSQSGVPTRIEVGVDPSTREKLAAVKQQLDEKQRAAEEAQKSVEYMRSRPTVDVEAVAQKEKARTTLEMEVAELNSQRKRLLKKLETAADARIEVEKNIFYGVQVVIGEKALTVDDDLESVTLRIEGDQIVYQ